MSGVTEPGAAVSASNGDGDGDGEQPRLAVLCGEGGWVDAGVTVYLGRPFLYPANSQLGQVLRQGYEWDRILRTLVPLLVHVEQPTILEVGSNIGASLVQILAAKPQAHVVAFEPSEIYSSFLRRNLRLALAQDVDVQRLALGSHPDFTHVYTDGTSGTTQELPDPSSRELVRVATLDDGFAGQRRVDFVKVDADGADLAILRGGEALLIRDRPIVLFELAPVLTGREPAREGLEFLLELGFLPFVALHPAGAPIGETERAEELLNWAEAIGYCDVLVCPDGLLTAAQRASVIATLTWAAALPFPAATAAP